MRHNKKKYRKLGTDKSHTKAMKKNLAVALFTNDRIKTTVTRAKAVRPLVESVITWAKKGDLHSRRLAIAALGDQELVREVFLKAEQGMWADRDGGYTRIMKLGPRKGDNAPMCILELVEEAPVKKGAKKDEKKADKKAEKKDQPKLVADEEEKPVEEKADEAAEVAEEASEEKPSEAEEAAEASEAEKPAEEEKPADEGEAK